MPTQKLQVATRKPRPPAQAAASATTAIAGQSSEERQAEATQVAEATASFPWSPVSHITDRQGLCIAIFGMPGVGKSTLGASATSVAEGSPLLVINFDGEIRSLGDRGDIMTWPGEKDNYTIKDWPHAERFMTTAARSVGNPKKWPFNTIMFDTINAGYDIAYKHVNETGRPNRDPRQIFGEANEKLLWLVNEWSLLSREQGLNVIFVCHAEEKQEGENGPMLLRMSVTPGVIKGMYQKVSAIGALQEFPGYRKLTLKNTPRIVAKYHQPQTGPQLPLEIKKPDLGKMILHAKGIEPYVQPAEKDANK